MKKVKFDFDATKQNIFVNQNAAVPVGAPVDQIGAVANNGNAIGIVIGAKKQVISGRFVKNLVVMVAGYCDIIDAQEIWGDEYSAEAIAAMSDIIFCDDHKIGGGGGWSADLPKPSVGGYGYTERGEQVLFNGDLLIDQPFGERGAFVGVLAYTLEVGATYKVVWDGVDYTCECIDGGHGFVYIGNASIMGFPIVTDEPFVFVVQYIDFTLVATRTTGTYSIKLSKIDDTIHTIDEKYLPEGGGGGNDFIIEMPSRTGALTESTIAQLDAIKEFVAGNMDKKEPYTIKCYVPHPNGNTAIIDCSVEYKFYDIANKPMVRITGSQLANMTYTEYGLEFYCIDFHQEGTWTQTSTPPWQYVLKTVGLEINSI